MNIQNVIAYRFRLDLLQLGNCCGTPPQFGRMVAPPAQRFVIFPVAKDFSLQSLRGTLDRVSKQQPTVKYDDSQTLQFNLLPPKGTKANSSPQFLLAAVYQI